MKAIYRNYAWDTIEPVMRPLQRVLMAVPTSLMSRYYRDHNEMRRATGNPEWQGAWFLPDDDPQWDALQPWAEMPFAWRLKSKLKRFFHRA